MEDRPVAPDLEALPVTPRSFIAFAFSSEKNEELVENYSWLLKRKITEVKLILHTLFVKSLGLRLKVHSVSQRHEAIERRRLADLSNVSFLWLELNTIAYMLF